MVKKYLCENHLKPISSSVLPAQDAAVIELMSVEEFKKQSFIEPEAYRSLQTLQSAQSTYLDVFPTFFVGSFALPDKEHLLGMPFCFFFYLNAKRLIFIESTNEQTADSTNKKHQHGNTVQIQHLLDKLHEQGLLKNPTPAYSLFECIKLLSKGDLAFLTDLENHMENLEEHIIEHGMKHANRRMLAFRRKLLRLDTYYQQLVDMTSSIADNENNLLCSAEARLFRVLERQTERLLKRALTLKEYSLQLRELYQAQIDIQQNNTMKFFTVVTTLFAPLTLLTSWFGMNFVNMPGLDWKWGYQSIIAVSLILVIAELILFRRKKWL